MAYVDSICKNSDTFNTLLAFEHTFINTQSIDADKWIDFPLGYDIRDDMSFKVIFEYGHCATTSFPVGMTINQCPVYVNQSGVIAPFMPFESPIQSITHPMYLQANTCLELYQTSVVGVASYVIVGNPIVYKSDDGMTVYYADGTKTSFNLSGTTLSININY